MLKKKIGKTEMCVKNLIILLYLSMYWISIYTEYSFSTFQGIQKKIIRR